MITLRRTLGVLALFAALLPFGAVTPLQAQTTDPNRITFDGSALVATVVNKAKERYTGAALPEIATNGTSAGIDALCAGTVDVAMSYGPMTEAQIAACAAKNVTFVETLLGYNAAVIAVNAGSPATCLSVDQVGQLLSPSSTVNNWRTIEEVLGESQITAFYGPPATDGEPIRFLLDRAIAGEGLRPDIQPLESAAAIGDKLTTETLTVGIMSLADFSTLTAQGKQIRALQIKDGTVCTEPSAVNLDEGRYPLSESLLMYVSTAALDRAPAADFVNFLLGTNGQRAVRETNFTAASDALYARGQNYVQTRRTGRTFSRLQAVRIPADTAGAVVIDGSPDVFSTLSAINAPFTPRYTRITFTTAAYGNAAGYRKLCAGAADVIGATRPATEAEAAACQTANIQTLQIPLGYEALVVLVSGKNTFAKCLSLENLDRVFNAKYTPKQWSGVAQGFPDLDILPLTPEAGSPEIDFLLARSSNGAVAPLLRADVTANRDALFRAAAVQNVEGGVTFVRWDEYLQVKSDVRAVQIDAGNGCVIPSEQSIKDGTYGLARPKYAILNLNNLTRPELRAYAWHLLSDDALTVLGREGLVGLELNTFIATRELLLERFAKAEADAAAAAAATAAPTQEATAAATPGN